MMSPRTTKAKRTLSPEQIQKMQEGRAKAREQREKAARQARQVAAVADIDKAIREHSSQSNRPIGLPHRRRRRMY